jgi:hypothetical protein
MPALAVAELGNDVVREALETIDAAPLHRPRFEIVRQPVDRRRERFEKELGHCLGAGVLFDRHIRGLRIGRYAAAHFFAAFLDVRRIVYFFRAAGPRSRPRRVVRIVEPTARGIQ